MIKHYSAEQKLNKEYIDFLDLACKVTFGHKITHSCPQACFLKDYDLRSLALFIKSLDNNFTPYLKAEEIFDRIQKWIRKEVQISDYDAMMANYHNTMGYDDEETGIAMV